MVVTRIAAIGPKRSEGSVSALQLKGLRNRSENLAPTANGRKVRLADLGVKHSEWPVAANVALAETALS